MYYFTPLRTLLGKDEQMIRVSLTITVTITVTAEGHRRPDDGRKGERNQKFDFFRKVELLF